MARGNNAVYAASKDQQDQDKDIIIDANLDPNVDINDILLKRLHNMGLLWTKETPTTLVLIIANSLACQFDLQIQSADHVDITFQGDRPPSSLFHELQDFIGITPEEWGVESKETLLTTISIFPSKPLNTDHSKVT